MEFIWFRTKPEFIWWGESVEAERCCPLAPRVGICAVECLILPGSEDEPFNRPEEKPRLLDEVVG